VSPSFRDSKRDAAEVSPQSVLFDPPGRPNACPDKNVPARWNAKPPSDFVVRMFGLNRRNGRTQMNLMTGAATASLERLRCEAASCRACPLWKNATQTVFGEGPSDAEIMLAGEQPGDREDLAGRPFVGPAGLLLNKALADAGVDRARVYVTNAVKHFKCEPRGKRRLHKRPNAGEIKVCSARWLIGEIEAIAPQLVVAL
jgi:uracil-DNA glycosylase